MWEQDLFTGKFVSIPQAVIGCMQLSKSRITQVAEILVSIPQAVIGCMQRSGSEGGEEKHDVSIPQAVNLFTRRALRLRLALAKCPCMRRTKFAFRLRLALSKCSRDRVHAT